MTESHDKIYIRNMEVIKYLEKLLNLKLLILNKNITDDKDIFIYKNYYITELMKLEEELDKINNEKIKIYNKYDYLFNKKSYSSNDLIDIIEYRRKIIFKNQYVPLLSKKIQSIWMIL